MTAGVLGMDRLGEAVSLLAQGRVVGIPTDTVYGLAARLDLDAVAGLFEAKRRPATLPIAVLCATAESAASVGASWPLAAQRLASSYWPGALTIVVPAPGPLAALVGATGSVGLRVPDDATCRAVLAATGPLAVTSANLHGEPPATTAAAVAASFDAALVAAVLDGGTCDGAVSTVVDVTGEQVIVVRNGAVDADDVRSASRG